MSKPHIIDAVAREFEKKFGVRLESHWNIVEEAYVSSLPDGETFTDEQKYWFNGFDHGWSAREEEPHANNDR